MATRYYKATFANGRVRTRSTEARTYVVSVGPSPRDGRR